MFGHHYFGKRMFGPHYWGPAVAAAVAQRSFDSADADPFYYDWWRRQARPRLETPIEQDPEWGEAQSPPVREEVIEAIISAGSLAEMRALELLAHERAALNRLIADYQKFLDDDEEEALLLALLH